MGEKENQAKSPRRIRYKFVGMDCTRCAKIVEKRLADKRGIKKVGASLMTDSVLIDFDQREISMEEIEKIVASTGLKAVRTASTLQA